VTVVFAFVFAASLATFAAIRALVGLRVSEAAEEAGLDIAEHGMYGYPEQFIQLEPHTNGGQAVAETI
jgi:ammonium transporter, Amt family